MCGATSSSGGGLCIIMLLTNQPLHALVQQGLIPSVGIYVCVSHRLSVCLIAPAAALSFGFGSYELGPIDIEIIMILVWRGPEK